MPVPGTMTSVNWVTPQDPTVYFGIPVVGYRTAEGTYLETVIEPDVKVPLDRIKPLTVKIRNWKLRQRAVERIVTI